MLKFRRTAPRLVLLLVTALLSGLGLPGCGFGAGSDTNTKISKSSSSTQISSITPTSGPATGGTTVNLAGTGFANGMTVTFGGTNATGVVVNSATSAQAVTPGHIAGLVDVGVQNTDNSTGLLSNGFTYTTPASLPPTITGVAPSSDTIAGGITVLVNGTNFVNGATVTFGSVPAPSVTFVSSTQLRVIDPPQAAGTVSVTVTNPNGQNATLPSSFTYSSGKGFVTGPSLTAVSPASGPPSGGTTVTLIGGNFTIGATVTFGGTAALSVTVVTGSQIQAVTSAHPSGTVDVIVTNPDGKSALLLASFTYTGLTVTTVQPSSGTANGGTTVLINGNGFGPLTSVLFGGSACSGATAISATQIQCVTPAHAAGAVDVTVNLANGATATLTGGFTYASSPTISSITPNSGTPAGGTFVTISGTVFIPGATVTFGGTPATNVLVVNSSTLQAVTPAHASGAVTVVVTNPDNSTATATNGYTYTLGNVVSIISVLPNTGVATGGDSVTLTGSGFQAGATVTFGGVAGVVTNNTPTSIMVTTPAGSGTVDVTVTNPDTSTATAFGAFTYTGNKFFNPAPSISSIFPTNGSTAGGTTLTIGGTNFQSGATVTIGGLPATGVALIGSQLTAITPSHAAGLADVTVTNPDSLFDTVSGGFTYNGISISSVSPNTGNLNGGTVVTVQGTFFQPGITVSFGGTNGSNVVIQNSSTLSVTAPAHPLGTVDVTVTNPDATTATLPASFTFVNPPTIGSVLPQAGSTAGATAVIITGTGYQAGTTVTFGGTPAAAVTLLSSTQLQVITPPGNVGFVNVTVNNPGGGSATVTNGFDYEPAPTIVYFSTGFESGVVAPMFAEKNPNATVVVTNTAANTGALSVRTSLDPATVDPCCSSIAQVKFVFSNANPPLTETNGMYQRWYMMMQPQSAITNADAGQIKLLLDRYNNGGGWLIGAIGKELNCSPAGQLGFVGDIGVFFLPGSCTQIMVQPGVWYEIETSFNRKNGTGHARVWIDGKLYVDGTDTRLGTDVITASFELRFGIAFTQHAAGPVTVYIDDVAAANGWLEPTK